MTELKRYTDDALDNLQIYFETAFREYDALFCKVNGITPAQRLYWTLEQQIAWLSDLIAIARAYNELTKESK